MNIVKKLIILALLATPATCINAHYGYRTVVHHPYPVYPAGFVPGFFAGSALAAFVAALNYPPTRHKIVVHHRVPAPRHMVPYDPYNPYHNPNHPYWFRGY